MPHPTALHVPNEFLCPITLSIMHDPVLCRNGLNYEKAAILTWMLKHNSSCPITRQKLKPSDLISNRTLQQKIQNWLLANGVPREQAVQSDDSIYHRFLQHGPIVCTCLASDIARDTSLLKMAKEAVRRWFWGNHGGRELIGKWPADSNTKIGLFSWFFSHSCSSFSCWSVMR
jgi:hypothetical protein